MTLASENPNSPIHDWMRSLKTESKLESHVQLPEEVLGDRGPLPSAVYRPLPASALLQSWPYGLETPSAHLAALLRGASGCSSLSWQPPPKSAEFCGVLSGCTMCPDHAMGSLIFLSKVF